jgi:hypothetical protein
MRKASVNSVYVSKNPLNKEFKRLSLKEKAYKIIVE